MYGGPIGTHQRSFEWYYPRPPMASPSSRLGVCNLATPLISGTGKATDFKFGGYIYRANPNKSPVKILEKNGAWVYPVTAQIFGIPLLSQERVKLWTSNFVGTFIRLIRTKAHEKCWEQQPWAQSGSPENFQGTHVQGALRRHICDSTAFLLFLYTVSNIASNSKTLFARIRQTPE